MRECGLEPLQFYWFRAAMRLYNSLTHCNSATMKKILQADMQLSMRSDDCWFPHALSAMERLAHSHIFKHCLVAPTHPLDCEPTDLSRFVVDLRTRHRHYWEPFSSAIRENGDASTGTWHASTKTEGTHCVGAHALQWLELLHT